jgi:hypothetical protein
MSGTDEKKAREERAARLHKQIEDLKRGAPVEQEHSDNLRYLIEKRMRELDENENPTSDGKDEVAGCK